MLEDGYWWNRGDVGSYFTEPRQFYMLSAIENLFAAPDSTLRSKSVLSYDQAQLHVTTLSQWLSDSELNVTQLTMDCQALLPARVTNPNLVVNEGLYDPLARLIATSLHKARPETSRCRIMWFEAARPGRCGGPPGLLSAGRFELPVPGYVRMGGDRQPTAVCSLAREIHVSDLAADKVSPITLEIQFIDGLAREIETKKASDPGPAIIRPRRRPRPHRQWRRAARRGGRALLGQRTHRVQQQGPAGQSLPAVFLNTPHSRITDVPRKPRPAAASTVIHYDALNRATRIDTPKGFFNLNVYRAWTRWLYDEDDTVKQSTYYQQNIDNPQTPLSSAKRCARPRFSTIPRMC